MIIRFEDSFLSKIPEIYNLQTETYVEKFVSYVTNSNTRVAVKLSPWLKNQVDNPSEELLAVANSIETVDDYDEQALLVLAWVKNNIIWTRENDGPWKATEYWATANEIITTLKMGYYRDDCDGFATISYVLCRLKGIPAERLYIFGGDVQSSPTAPVGGHAWLGYRPTNYPLNWTFLDGCYHPSLRPIESRPLFYVNGKDITGSVMSKGVIGDPELKYKRIWFAFNENKSHLSLKWLQR